MKIEISEGDFYDKLSILKLKMLLVTDSSKLKNIEKEFDELIQNADLDILSNPLYKNLCKINDEIWHIEDKIRQKEVKKEFDQEFIELARSVYIKNDERARIKRR
jgi:hypothetical protein